MSRTIDRGSEREEEMRDDALEEQRLRAGLGDPEQWETLSAEQCAGCDTRIPDARRQAYSGTQLCVECQSDAEQSQMTRYGRGG